MNENKIKQIDDELRHKDKIIQALQRQLINKEIVIGKLNSREKAADSRVKSLEQQLEETKQLTPSNISSVLQGVFCVYYACV